MKPSPPHIALKFLRWFCREDYLDEVEGDLIEIFEHQYEKSPSAARRKFTWTVLRHFRPEFIRAFRLGQNSTHNAMLKNYFKISYRNLVKNRAYSFINIGGLAIGMAVAMIIGLWVNRELSHDRYHKNYDHVAQVMHNSTAGGTTYTSNSQARPLEFILREEYGNSFKHIVMASWSGDHVLTQEGVVTTQRGIYMQEGAGEMLSLDILSGVINGLDEPNQIMLSASAAKALFGDKEAVGQSIRMDNSFDLKVSAIFADFPLNTSFHRIKFIAPWQLYVNSSDYIQRIETVWDHSFQIFVQIADNTDIPTVTERIRHVPAEKDEQLAEYQTELFLHPMKDWHLNAIWKDGVQSGGRMQYVILFSIIGVFVLLLACINFMNLSTARSQKRAKEVGIRKSIGSIRSQIIGQFLSESFLVVVLAFLLAFATILLVLPVFNDLMNDQIEFPWASSMFWAVSACFILVTAFISGSYPAFYLSSFRPIQALKGTMKVGRGAGMARRVLVVMQFTVSITLIICTLLIFRQVQFSKERPIGYDREGLIQIKTDLSDFHGKYDIFRNSFIESGAVLEMSASHSPLTGVWSGSSGFTWEGMPEGFQSNFGTVRISHDYGKSVNWEILEGRDFSRELASDSSAVIINETAREYMGLEDPIGKVVYMGGTRGRTIIGVVKDMVMESPYQPVRQTLYTIGSDFNFYALRLNPARSIQKNITSVERTFKKILPEVPFHFDFVDNEYAQKFRSEERIGSLARVFTGLAIFISCLGLFGLSSFMAEQRSKEIGVRKVLGASIANLWRLLVKDFLLLVVVACLIAIPLAYYFMNDWVQQFEYRTEISWWVMLLAATAGIVITLVTVSYQTIKAASVNPVKSLKTE